MRRRVRYLLIGTVTVLVMAGAFVPSAGLAATVGGADRAAPAVGEELRDLPADPGAAGGLGWAASASADGDEGCCDDGHMWGWDAGWWWWLLMPIGMIVFWGGIIALIVWGVRQLSDGRRDRDGAIDIARARYARGEISKEEFEQLRRDLT